MINTSQCETHIRLTSATDYLHEICHEARSMSWMYYEGNYEGKSKSKSKADVYPAFSSLCSSTVAIANPGLQGGEDDRNKTTAG